jgi:subtilase family serine protease
MHRKRKSIRVGWLPFISFLLITAIIAFVRPPQLSASSAGKMIAHNTPRYLDSARNLGSEDPSKVIEVSIWLQVHNQSEFDALTASLYNPKSPNYRHWLKPKDIAARFGPTDDEAKTIRQFFADHNLKIVKTGPYNFYVRASGAVGDVEKAFHVQINNYESAGKVIRSNAGDPFVEGAAGDLVRAVSGLDNGGFTHSVIVRQTSLGDGAGVSPLTSVGPSNKTAGVVKPAGVPASEFFSSQCMEGTETLTFSNEDSGTYPIGTYSGNKLNLASETSLGCAYTPPVIQAAYNLTGLYTEHDQFDGTGQTIAIIDWCGTPTILDDANAFSAEFGLPQLSSGNQQPFLGIIYTAPSLCIDWGRTEINLDVEWAHAVAPGANINLVVPPSSDFQDVNQAEFDVVNDTLGTVLSGSYGTIEASTSTSELEIENFISEMAAAVGISTNFATGDYGDYTYYGFPQTVNAPADSPWATAVGGISLMLNANNQIAWQSGWGTNWGAPVNASSVTDPPGGFGFEFGGGGGMSSCLYQDSSTLTCTGGFAKPAFQSALPGQYRQLPDISWLADPTTGAAILISEPEISPPQIWQIVGGTSLSTPMFSALWAIANQEAEIKGGPPLGQAAAYLYSLPANTIRDVVPVASAHNVTAKIQESTGTNKYNAGAVLGGEAPEGFVSALWEDPFEAFTLVWYSFGTDCSALTSLPGFGPTPCTDPAALATAPGWDDVTGVGTPNAKAFADHFGAK